MNVDDDDVSSKVLTATLEHALRSGAMSGVKRFATEFVARLFLVSCPMKPLFATPSDAYPLHVWLTLIDLNGLCM